MREQAIASRGSRRANSSNGFVQRPARRDGATGSGRDFSLRALFAYVPIALKAILVVLIIVMLVVGYRAAASAAMFQVRGIDVVGASRTSVEEIESLTRRAVARTGVWRADLPTLSAELTRLPGVRRAIVTRVLPDRLRVRIVERAPLAVLRTSSGHFVWVDEEGVMLGELKPTDHLPAFFLRGLSEDSNDEARADNSTRVQKYQELVQLWQTLGLSDRVSEVNLIDLRDVRAQLSGNDSQIEVRLGGQDLGNHLKLALEVLDRYKQSMNGANITYVDLQGDRVILGTNSGANISSSTGTASADPDADIESAPAGDKKANKDAAATRNQRPATARPEDKNPNRQRVKTH